MRWILNIETINKAEPDQRRNVKTFADEKGVFNDKRGHLFSKRI